MELTSLYGDQRLNFSEVIVQVDSYDRSRAEALVTRAGAIVAIDDEQSFAAAKRLAGELRAMIDEIAAAKKAANSPFKAVSEAIASLATEVGTPVEGEHRRVLGLINDYVTKIEQAEALALAKAAEAFRQQQAIHEQSILQAQRAVAEARTKEERLRAQMAEEQAKLKRELAVEIADQLANRPKKALVPGGRVDHRYQFVLDDVLEVIQAGNLHLLRWEIDYLKCFDAVKAQLDRNPNAEPILPGIKISRQTSVSLKAAARTRIR
jgi:hypothetical protein